ncbi:MAG: hypothetical protein WDO17_08555 [Alphaproteobacteria bacterium]
MSDAETKAGKFGIKVRLQAAFGAVAITTVIAAAVAIMSFSETERGFERVSTREVPTMTDALRLSAASGEISAAAARYVAAKTSDDRRLIAAQIASRSRDLDAIMERLRVGQGDAGGFSIAEPMAQRLKENLNALEKAISDRTEIRDALDARLAALHAAHAKISDKLSPIVDDSYFEVVTTAEDVGQSGDITVRTLIQGGMQVMQAMVEVGSETNLVTGLLTAGALTSSPRHPGDAGRPLRGRGAPPRKAAGQDSPGRQVRAAQSPRARAHQARKLQGARGWDRDGRLTQVFRAHEQLNNLLIGLIDDLNFDVVMQSEDAVKRSSKLVKDLVAVQIASLRSALEVAAQTHLVTSLLSEAAVAKDAAVLVPMQDRFNTATDLLAKAAKTLINNEIKDAIGELTVYGQGDNSLFALRNRELAAIATADRTVERERHDPALARPRGRGAGRRCREIDAIGLGEADRGPRAQTACCC